MSRIYTTLPELSDSSGRRTIPLIGGLVSARACREAGEGNKREPGNQDFALSPRHVFVCNSEKGINQCQCRIVNKGINEEVQVFRFGAS